MALTRNGSIELDASDEVVTKAMLNLESPIAIVTACPVAVKVSQ
ncbi:hypothetical protein ACNKHP_11990 [Shigella boydii]